MRKFRMKVIWVFLLGVVLLSLGGGLFAAGKTEDAGPKSFLFKYGNQQPENHSRSKSMIWFKDEIEKRTKGVVKMEVYHSGTLGTEKEMFEMTVTGALQGYRGAFYEQLNPQFNLYNLPFLFQSYEEMIAFNASDMAADMCKKGSVKGVYIPATGYTGFRTVVNVKRPILLPEDLKGIKMRAPGQAPIINFYKLLGANPQEMAWSEVYMALKQGVIDGGDNAPTNIEAAKVYEVAPYFSALNYMAGADPLMVNMAWYQSLPENVKPIFNQVAKEALQYWDQMEKDAAIKAIEKISNYPGVKAIDMAKQPKEAAIWEAAAKPLWQQMVDAGFFSWDDIKRAQTIIMKVRK